jgi:hypothetical protein
MSDLIRKDGPRVYFNCPGCESRHTIMIAPSSTGTTPVWTWNGSKEAPTFSPSLLVQGYDYKNEVKQICHSFITNGRIKFLEDCTHSLAGQTVDLREQEQEGL